MTLRNKLESKLDEIWQDNAGYPVGYLDETVKAIEALIASRVQEARIDELNKLLDETEWLDVRYDPNEPTSNDHSEEAISADIVKDRLLELKSGTGKTL